MHLDEEYNMELENMSYVTRPGVYRARMITRKTTFYRTCNIIYYFSIALDGCVVNSPGFQINFYKFSCRMSFDDLTLNLTSTLRNLTVADPCLKLRISKTHVRNIFHQNLGETMYL